MEVGFAVNTNNRNSLDHFIQSISIRELTNTIKKIKCIPKAVTIDKNVDFFNFLKESI